MTDRQKSGFREGMRQSLGILSAFKEAVEETINEAKERGDLTPERAKEIMKQAMDRAQEAAGEARERFDFVSRRELDALKARVARIEGHLGLEAFLDGGGEEDQEGPAEPGA